MSAEAGPSAPEQTGPVVVYAATGYTGTLVSRELARRGASFRIAGRSRDKLDALAASLDGTGSTPEVHAAPLDDPAALRSALDGAASVIACAGPFMRHGDAVLEAAVDTGTHYLDTTGEQPFIKKVFDVHDVSAREQGAALVSGMGFDYLPGDMLAALTGAGLGPLSELAIAYSIRGFGPTRGTALSAVGMMGGGDVEWVSGSYRNADRSTGRGSFSFPSPIGSKRVGRYPAGEQITVPKHLEVDTVRTLIDLHSVSPPQLGPLGAPVMTATGYLMDTPVSKLAEKVIAHLPEGPTEEARKAVRYTLVAEARPRDRASGTGRRGVLRGPDVYGITAVTTVEGALRMAAPGYDRSGALAPSQAYDPADFLAALAPHGVRWELADLDI